MEVGVDGGRERFGMVEMRFDGARPDHPPPAGVLQQRRQLTANVRGEHRSPPISPVGSRPGGVAPRPPTSW